MTHLVKSAVNACLPPPLTSMLHGPNTQLGAFKNSYYVVGGGKIHSQRTSYLMDSAVIINWEIDGPYKEGQLPWCMVEIYPWSETRCFKANLSTLHIAFMSICTFDRGGVGINARPHYATSRAYLCDAMQSFLDLRVPFSAPSLPPARNDAAAAGEGQRQNRALKKIHRTNICILVHKGKFDTCWLRCRGSIA